MTTTEFDRYTHPHAALVNEAAESPADSTGEFDGILRDLSTTQARMIVTLATRIADQRIALAEQRILAQVLNNLPPREVVYVPTTTGMAFTTRVVRAQHWWAKVAIGALLGFLAGLALLIWVLNPGTVQFFGVTGMIGDVVDTWGFELVVLAVTTIFGGLGGVLVASKTTIWLDISAPDLNTGELAFVGSVSVNN